MRLLGALLLVSLAAIAADPPTVAETPTRARTTGGEYISWKEHLIDDEQVNGGVPIRGGDGLKMADFDKDGHLDIVSVHEDNHHIRLAFGSADPDKWELVTLAEGEEAKAAEDAAVADLNGDGWLDIIVACELSHLIYFQNPGKGTRNGKWPRVIPEVTRNRGSFIRVFFADLDGDGRPEVTAANKGEQLPRVREGEKHPFKEISWFRPPANPLDSAGWEEHVLGKTQLPENARPIDLDGDGDLDVLSGSRWQARSFWFENLGGRPPRFRERKIEVTGRRVPWQRGAKRFGAFMVDFHDFDSDGRVDIVINETPNDLTWIEQPDDLSQPWPIHPIGTIAPDNSAGITVADINGDGASDVIFGGYSRNPRDHDGPDVTAEDNVGRIVWFENPGDPKAKWVRHDISRRKRGMFDGFVARDMDGDGDLDIVGTRGNSGNFDGVYWLEQVRTATPVKAFTPARAQESQHLPLPRAERPTATEIADWRNIRTGHEIPTETYADQPYIVKTDDGAWLVCLTTGSGREGQAGQHIVTLRSSDQGRTWESPVDVEPAIGPEASYAVMLKVPSGRVYVFYNHNTDNVRRVKADNPPYKDGWCTRVDSLGHFVFKYSDDHGRSWSRERYDIPQRDFEIDRNNADGGRLKYFWNVGKAFVHEDAGYVPLIKVGGFGEGFFTSNEGVLLRSGNILTEEEPRKIRWETLPEGDVGLRTPPGGGPIAGEQSYSVLSDGSIYAVYRTIDGHPAFSYSRDGGRSWETPQYKRYADGRLMKHPRAANFAWRCENGKYLYWFHNHGGRFIREHPQRRSMAYRDRNPVWLSGGIEVDSPNGKVIQWSQPEVVLYDDDTFIRMSYPDLVEEGGKYYLTETQKDVARVHEIDPTLLEGLWNQFEPRSTTREGLILELNAPVPSEAAMPRLPTFLERSSTRADHGTHDLRAGFTIDLSIKLEALGPGQVLLDSRRDDGQGLLVQTTDRGTVEVVLNDGRTESRWDTDPGMIQAGESHNVVTIVDGGPKIISFVVDGKFNDGGDHRQFGWGRFNPNLYHANGSKTLRIGPAVQNLRLYNRALRISEVIVGRRPSAAAGPQAGQPNTGTQKADHCPSPSLSTEVFPITAASRRTPSHRAKPSPPWTDCSTKLGQASVGWPSPLSRHSL